MNRLPAMRVAIVGAGPAGLYAAADLLGRSDLAVEIDIFERLPTPWGLVRAGVAPDHPQKKLIIDRLFNLHLNDGRTRFFGNVDIGVDIALDDLKSLYHAVIFTVGANGDTKLGIAGEALPGCFAARDFVGFYNGHPDFIDRRFDLSSPRAVIVGNGNVALDIARILTTPLDALERTDMADHALAALAQSRVEEVVILGRRGPQYAAYNAPELEEFGVHADIDVSIAGIDADDFDRDVGQAPSWTVRRKLEILRRLASRAAQPGRKRVVFRFYGSPVALRGQDRVEAIEVALTRPASLDASLDVEAPRATDVVETRLVFRACGYRGVPVADLPFDTSLGVIANREGRVVADGDVVPGVYVAGWIKRGCRGVIGSNKQCARETVAGLIEDASQGRLSHAIPSRDVLLARVARMAPAAVALDGWLRIDRAERTAGRKTGRPRIKLATREALMATAGPSNVSEDKGLAA